MTGPCTDVCPICGSTDERKPNPDYDFKWECLRCGRLYDHPGRNLTHNEYDDLPRESLIMLIDSLKESTKEWQQYSKDYANYVQLLMKEKEKLEKDVEYWKFAAEKRLQTIHNYQKSALPKDMPSSIPRRW